MLYNFTRSTEKAVLQHDEEHRESRESLLEGSGAGHCRWGGPSVSR